MREVGGSSPSSPIFNPAAPHLSTRFLLAGGSLLYRSRSQRSNQIAIQFSFTARQTTPGKFVSLPLTLRRDVHAARADTHGVGRTVQFNLSFDRLG
jgi:hypothetical protein